MRDSKHVMRLGRRGAAALAIAAGALGACSDGEKANEAAGDATGDSAAGYSAPGTGAAVTDSLRPAPGSGAAVDSLKATHSASGTTRGTAPRTGGTTTRP